MKIVFSTEAWDDYVHWQAMDKNVLKRINKLIEAIQRNPFDGIGKLEPLKFNLTGYWSRRITEMNIGLFMRWKMMLCLSFLAATIISDGWIFSRKVQMCLGLF